MKDRIDLLLKPISEENPCGLDLSTQTPFALFCKTLRYKPEVDDPPDWDSLDSKAEEFAAVGKHLELFLGISLIWLKNHGLPGWAAGLQLIHQALETYWQPLFPRLDPADPDSILERVSLVENLTPADIGYMAGTQSYPFKDFFLDAPLCEPEAQGYQPLSLRQIKLAAGELQPATGDSQAVSSAAAIDAVFDATSVERLRETLEVATSIRGRMESIRHVFSQYAGPQGVPNLKGISACVDDAVAKLKAHLQRRGYDVPTEESSKTPPPLPSPTEVKSQATGDIDGEQDVHLALDRIITYYHNREPSSPVPLLLHRAKKLVGLNYLDIVKDLTPTELASVKKLGGIQEEEEAQNE